MLPPLKAKREREEEEKRKQRLAKAKKTKSEKDKKKKQKKKSKKNKGKSSSSSSSEVPSSAPPSQVSEEDEEALDFVGFLVGLVFVCFPPPRVSAVAKRAVSESRSTDKQHAQQ